MARPGLIADATVTGTIRDSGLRYTLGVYDVADWRQRVPVNETFQAVR